MKSIAPKLEKFDIKRYSKNSELLNDESLERIFYEKANIEKNVESRLYERAVATALDKYDSRGTTPSKSKKKGLSMNLKNQLSRDQRSLERYD